MSLTVGSLSHLQLTHLVLLIWWGGSETTELKSTEENLNNTLQEKQPETEKKNEKQGRKGISERKTQAKEIVGTKNHKKKKTATTQVLDRQEETTNEENEMKLEQGNNTLVEKFMKE